MGEAVGEVVSREALVERLTALRVEGKTVVLANGCFDILHVGHARYLQGAALEADILVVAINDDASVRALKGPDRPVMDAASRAELVAALRPVHFVVTFPELSPSLLIQEIRPDVHCKGPDYTPETVPERDVVRAYGGRTVIVGGPKDYSTRDIVARLRASS